MNKQLEQLERERKKLEELLELQELTSEEVIKQSAVVGKLILYAQQFS